MQPSDGAMPAGTAETSRTLPEVVPSILRFGVFELDLRGGELRRRGVLVHLSGQPLRLLSFLALRAGQLVRREEIRSHLWQPGTYVEADPAINGLIRVIRRALGDDAGTQRFVATMPRCGYRFTALVEVVRGDGGGTTPSGGAPVEGRDGPEAAGRRSRLRLARLGTLAALATVAVAVVLAGRRRRPARASAVPAAAAISSR